MTWLAVKALFGRIASNLWTWLAFIVGAVVLGLKVALGRAKKGEAAANKEAQEAQAQAAGYEAVNRQRKTIEAEVHEVRERQKTDANPDLTKPW